ncbi:MAG: hypothetical protein JWM55_776, partial [Acidimicrobiaceae bacterium]|nr:hypothetical protein [Acidimicrobiaceae bacterium]
MNLLTKSSLKRLLGTLALFAVLAVMTGAPGGYGVPADTGVHGSFLEHVSFFGLVGTQRWTIFLTLGVLAWLIVSWYQPHSLTLRRRLEPVTMYPSKVMQRRSSRMVLIVAVII